MDRPSPAAQASPTRSSLVGLYAWAATIAFGFILLDVLYARMIGGAPGEANNLLLGWSVLTAAVGVFAVAASLDWPVVRNLLLASLFLVALEVLVPVLASGLCGVSKWPWT